MGTAESSPSSEVAGLTGLTNQSSFHRQSPNIARLIRSENSSKMEYEFPISDVPIGNSPSHHHNSSSKHTILTGNHHHHHRHYSNSSPTSDHSVNHTGYHLTGYNDNLNSTKISSHSSSSLWFSLTSCFGCRLRHSNSSNMNPLRDKVHAIRIVRASNDLTPAVFDSHYNIITLEQLRECDNNPSGNLPSLPNDYTNSTSTSNSTGNVTAHNGNGSVSSSSKKDSSHRMRKKKKKRSTTTTTTTHSASSKPMSISDDDDDGSGRT